MPRQSGYRVTIRGFLPADRKSLEDTGRAVKLVQQAIADPKARGELLDALVGVELEVTSTTRVVDAEPAQVTVQYVKTSDADAEPFA